MAHWTIRADYDPEASVWYSVDGDIPGFAADATTLEALVEKAAAMLPDLLDIHANDIADPARLAGPHRIASSRTTNAISRLRPKASWSGDMPRRFAIS